LWWWWDDFYVHVGNICAACYPLVDAGGVPGNRAEDSFERWLYSLLLVRHTYAINHRNQLDTF
jgi:hypothetical protein